MTDNAEEFRQKENCWQPFLHQVPNDQDQALPDNYYTNPNCRHCLDKCPLTPSQNAQRYFFKRFRELLAVKHLTELIVVLKATILYLGVEINFNRWTGRNCRKSVKQLIQTGFTEDANARKSRNAKTRTVSGERWEKPSSMLVETICKTRSWPLKWLRKEELCLHAKDIPGSHVVQPGNSTFWTKLRQMAELAAYLLGNACQIWCRLRLW